MGFYDGMRGSASGRRIGKQSGISIAEMYGLRKRKTCKKRKAKKHQKSNKQEGAI